MRLFITLNGGRWEPEPPVIDQAEHTMVGVAAGDIDEAAPAEWLRHRVTFD